MRLVVQRSKYSYVEVNGEKIGEIEKGFVVLVGISEEDTENDVNALVQKLIHLRIFEDENDKMNLSLIDVAGSILSVSQFTLYADIRKGRRPNFMNAASPDKAEKLYDYFNALLRQENIHVETGKFGAMMNVSIANDGPVTIIMETKNGSII